MDDLFLMLVFLNLAKAYATSAASGAQSTYTDDGDGNITITQEDS